MVKMKMIKSVLGMQLNKQNNKQMDKIKIRSNNNKLIRITITKSQMFLLIKNIQ